MGRIPYNQYPFSIQPHATMGFWGKFISTTQNRKKKLRSNVLGYNFSFTLQTDSGKDLKSKLIKVKPEHDSSKHTFLVPLPHQPHLEKSCKMLNGKARNTKFNRSY